MVAASPPAIVRVDTLLRGLEVPWGVAVLADGGLFVAERPGRIRYLARGADSSVVWATLDVYAKDPGIGPEAGLMGIAVDPDTSRGLVLYAMATTWRTPGDRARALPTRLWRRVASLASPVGALKYKNQILRLTKTADGAVRTDVLVDDLPTAFYHAGGGLAVGPDGLLYATVGDALLPPLARDPRVPVGKLLRYRRDGGVPEDNPAPDSPVFARGLRNTQAFAWLPDGTLLGVDHGPTGMQQEQRRRDQDELNVLKSGGDYGWPHVTGWQTATGITSPAWMWERAIAPAGLAVRPSASADTAQVLVGGLRGSLEQLTLVRTAGTWTVAARAVVADGTFGRIRTVVVAPDGSALLTTSNRDVRGVRRPGDDLLLRVTLAP
jgi:glucose/arabinose dehydrogenase